MSGSNAGWFADPQVHGQLRYWDGARWTEHVAPDPNPTPAVSVPQMAPPAPPVPVAPVPQMAPPAPPAANRPIYAAPPIPSRPSSERGRPRLFGGGKQQIEELESENDSLRTYVAQINGLEPLQLAEATQAARVELGQVQASIQQGQQQLAAVQGQVAAANAQLVQTEDIAMLQEVGLYTFTHPLDDAPTYKARLEECRQHVKELVRNKDAVDAVSGWTVNNSAAEGRRMVNETSKLMLNAYNAEVDNVIRTLKPYKLDAAIDRISKTRDKIARLGKIMQINVATAYHEQRLYEVRLTADYMRKVEEEKEAQRAERARQREEDKARKEFEAEKARLRKEQAHYAGAHAKLVEAGDAVGAAELAKKLEEIGASITDVESREANIRTGHVYVISNIGAFGEGVVKIGMTRRLQPDDRVRELGDASVPFRYDTHALIFSSDAVGLETRLHQHFADARINRVNLRREFFAVSPAQVRDALSEIDDQYLLHFRETPEAEEWRASQNIGDSLPEIAHVDPPSVPVG